MTDRVPGAPGQHRATIAQSQLQKLQNGEPFLITLQRDDQPVETGTPYSKDSVLPDSVAERLCPGVEDPSPADAFQALLEGKSDGIQKRTGSELVLTNAAHTPLKGLRLFGKTSETGFVGDSGSISVTVGGKNLAPGVEAVLKDQTLTATFEGNTITYNGTSTVNTGLAIYSTDRSFVLLPGTYTLSIRKISGICPNDGSMAVGLKTPNSVWLTGAYFGYYGNTLKTATFTLTEEKEVVFCFLGNGTYQNAVFTFQIEAGNTVTDFEPYRQLQSLTVSTPYGLKSDDRGYRDEIDFARGVYIQRVGLLEPAEMALPAGVVEAYAQFHTYQPTTRIINDAGAEMEVAYYTHSTAVQMVHTPQDAGKILAVDRHGCVALSNRSIVEFGVSGGWYYRKWGDGFAECWGKFSQKITKADGTPPAQGDKVTVNIPLPFRFAPGKYDSVIQLTLLGVRIGTVLGKSPELLNSTLDQESDGIDAYVIWPEDNFTTMSGSAYVAGMWK